MIDAKLLEGYEFDRAVDANGDTMHEAWQRLNREYPNYREIRRMLLTHGVTADVLGEFIGQHRALKLRFFAAWFPTRILCKRII